MRTNYLLPVVLAFTMLVGAAGCGRQESVLETGQESVETLETAAAESSNVGDMESTTKNEESETAQTYVVGSMGDDYLLPDAQTHIYTKEELSALTPEELRVARNEIYARHSRKFKSGDLVTYFSSKPWYQPSVEADAFDDAILNPSERGNLAVLKEAESAAAAGMIACPKIGRYEFPRIDGSTATIPISQAIYCLATGATMREAEGVIRHDKTTQAYLNLMAGRETDLVIAYEYGDRVKQRLAEQGDNLIIKPVGRDALVFMANGGNPVKSLARSEVVDIYTGKLTNWKSLGGRNQDIRAFQRPANSGSQNLMEKLVMKGTAMAEAPQSAVVTEMGELIEEVAAYDNTGEALGYSVYFYAKNMYQRPELKFMAVDGVMPSSDSIRSGSYPYVSDFYAAIRTDEPKDSTTYQLFEWLTSDDGQALVNELGYVGIREVNKTFPEGFGQDEVFEGKIPLARGEVILASGKYLFGESGIGVFDQSMRLMKFIRHVDNPFVSPFGVWDINSPISLLDTQRGKYGLYSLAEERWVEEPVQEEPWEVETGIFYYGEDEFAEKYPQILTELGVDKSAIFIYSTEYQESLAVIETDHANHYYDMSGTRLFTFDKTLLNGKTESGMYPVIVSENLAYLTVFEPGEGINTCDYIYRDGVLVKKLESNETSGPVSEIEDYFYTRDIGNYLYVYNYQDEACAKFLVGYYQND